MKDAYELYQEVLDKINKEENGYLPPEMFNRLAKVADRHVFNDYQSRLQNPNTAAIEKGELQDRLHFCLQNIPIAVANGIIPLPADYGYFSSAKITYDGGDAIELLNYYNKQICDAEEDPTIDISDAQAHIDAIQQGGPFVNIELVDGSQVGMRLNSYIPGKRPSARKPIMERVPGGFQLYPPGIASVIFKYYRRPVPGKLVMTIDPATLLPVYDVNNSKAFEWSDEALNDIEMKISNDFAVHVRERDLYAMTAQQQAR